MNDGFKERRQTNRHAIRSLVEVKLPDWETLRRVYTVNLSLGGVRLSLGARPLLGAAVDLIFTLPNGERLHLWGTVAHLGHDDSGDVGVRFGDLSRHVHDEIERYLDDLAHGRPLAEAPEARGIPSGVLIKKTT